MGRYIIKRIISSVITIFFIMTLTFFLMKSIPGDPFSGKRMLNPEIKKVVYAKYGLDKPLFEQYLIYLKNYLKGDFGVSYRQVGLTTKKIILSGFPYSLKIGLYASVFIIISSIFLGTISALRQNKLIDRIVMIIATLGATIPSFVFASLFLYIFSKELGLVPSFGVGTWKHYIGPVICISTFNLGFLTRLTRTSVLDIIQQDYIRTARAKGLSEFTVIGKHVLKNALIPIVTYVGPMIALLLTGSFVIERVFGIPGIGQLFTSSILNRDYTLIMGVTVFFAAFLLVLVLIGDIIYALVDPRIKYD